MNLEFGKYTDGLVPAIVQDDRTGRVLMLGFMNAKAIDETKRSGRVTFYSRSKQRLWEKGETSGNLLDVVSVTPDCDADTILIKAIPAGPICHTGSDTCFGEANRPDLLSELEAVITQRKEDQSQDSYVSSLFREGLNKIAQKVGEESVEVVIAAKDDDLAAFKGEVADLIFHLLILLQAKGLRFGDVLDELASRRRS